MKHEFVLCTHTTTTHTRKHRCPRLIWLLACATCVGFLSRKMLEKFLAQGGNISTHRGVILTSYFTFADDPQRHRRVIPSFDYFANFWNSARHHGLEVIVVHNGLPHQFIQLHSTRKIRFHEVTVSRNWSTNDYRFYSYSRLDALKNYDYVLVSDLSDVFFNGDPFLFMSARVHSKFFVSFDQGKFHSKAWKVEECYDDEASHWDQQKSMYNAGVWGGGSNEVACFLNCIVRELERVLTKRNLSYNCNMPTFNWCVHNSMCSNETTLHEGGFVNPFREQCHQPYPIIHNKCKNMEGLVCLTLEEASTFLVIRDKLSNGCSKLY